MPASTSTLSDQLDALLAPPVTDDAIEDLFGLLEASLLRMPGEAMPLCERVVAQGEALGHARLRAYGYGLRGYARYLQSYFEEALPDLYQARALFEQQEDPDGLGMTLGALASTHMSLGDFERALECGLRSLDLFRHTGNQVQEAWTLHGLGGGVLEMGTPDRARSYFEQALALFEALGEPLGEARALSGLGSVLLAENEPEAAIAYHERSLTLFRAHHNPLGEARALHDLGLAYLAQDRLGEALPFFEDALRLREQVGNRLAQCSTLVALGRLHLKQDALDAAEQVLMQSLQLAEALRSKMRLYQTHEVLADLFEQRNDAARALHHYRQYHHYHEAVLGEEARARLIGVRVRYEVEQTEKEAALTRAHNEALQTTNERLREVIDELQTTQAQLVQSEKMASLGRLTAGIAHEIKNPLNFVNNFAQLSVELTDELRVLLAGLDAVLEPYLREELGELLDDLALNATKINEHGRRADGIVRSMLDHARGTAGQRRSVDFNALVEEYASLAYHGMRAQDADFNVTIEQALGPEVGRVEVVPMDLGRVLINLLNNAFYAVRQRSQAEEQAYEPTVSLRTARQDDQVVLRIADNGAGIPEALQGRIFEPFFTTKPTGEGTGLGLSLSYEIITQGHGGTFEVEPTDIGAAFVLTLPAPRS